MKLFSLFITAINLFVFLQTRDPLSGTLAIIGVALFLRSP